LAKNKTENSRKPFNTNRLRIRQRILVIYLLPTIPVTNIDVVSLYLSVNASKVTTYIYCIYVM